MKTATTLLAALAIRLGGCGETSSSSSTGSPQQYDNAQRDVGYLKALNQIMRPFSKPPANPTDYTRATTRLRTAISQLGMLIPPAPFAPSQAHLVAGLHVQAALSPRMARASAAHDSVALNNLYTQVLAAEGTIRAAGQELVDEFNGCRASKFRTC